MKITDTYYQGVGTQAEVFDLSASTAAPLTIIGGGGADYILGGSFDYLDKFMGQTNLLVGGDGSDVIIAGQSPTRIYGDHSADPADANGAADLILGGVFSDQIFAGAGNDFVNGGGNADHIEGGLGDDTLWGGFGRDEIHGGGGNDDIYANSAKSAPNGLLSITTDWNGVTDQAANPAKHGGIAGEISHGGDFAGDVMFGDAGNDHLHGDHGMDTMTGGAGSDHFVFDVVSLGSNHDVITDFSHHDDTIDLDNAVLAGLGGNGWLAPGKFFKGAHPHDASDRIIYNPATGMVLYDHDGKGGDPALALCKLAPHLPVTFQDFLVV
jgi:Ca2+-binding RTX toxin-like protein